MFLVAYSNLLSKVPLVAPKCLETRSLCQFRLYYMCMLVLLVLLKLVHFSWDILTQNYTPNWKAQLITSAISHTHTHTHTHILYTSYDILRVRSTLPRPCSVTFHVNFVGRTRQDELRKIQLRTRDQTAYSPGCLSPFHEPSRSLPYTMMFYEERARVIRTKLCDTSCRNLAQTSPEPTKPIV